MNDYTIYVKTEKGEEEIEKRKYGIPVYLRHIMILVDGKSNVSKILEKGKGLPDIANSLEILANQGFIDALPFSEVDNIRAELIRIARDTLGEDAERIVNKIQAAPSTRKGFVSAIDNCHKLVKMVIDEKKAEELIKRCRDTVSKLDSINL